MSQEQVQSEKPETECAVCGHVPGPFPECGICNGKAQTKKRAYTLTEERQGVGSNDPDRYDRYGNVHPKIVDLPGSFNPTQPRTKNP